MNPRNSLCDTVSKTSSSPIINKINNNNNNSSTNINSKVFNDLTNDKTLSDSTSNKSINNSTTVSGSWRVNFQNNIIGRLGAAFAAATGHVTTSTHHHILVSVIHFKLSNVLNSITSYYNYIRIRGSILRICKDISVKEIRKL